MSLLDWVKPQPQRSFSGSPDARAYAIGDIHGRLDLLDALLARIAADLHARPVELVVLVFLGDYIDRGPQSAQVIERLRTFGDFPAQVICLKGNHEDSFLRALAGEPNVAYDWLRFGGDATAQSYGLAPAPLELADEAGIARALNAAMPASHVAFLRALHDGYYFGDYLFVHAGIRPGIAIEAQEARDLMWIRQPFLTDKRDHGVMVVHGHTIVPAVDVRPNRIGIDTGAYRSGVLTALAVEGEERWFLDTAQP